MVGKSAYGTMAVGWRKGFKPLDPRQMPGSESFPIHDVQVSQNFWGPKNLCFAFPVAAYFCNFQGSLCFGGFSNLRGIPKCGSKNLGNGVHDSGVRIL